MEVGETIRKRAEEVDRTIVAKEIELEHLHTEVRSLKLELNDLSRALRALESSNSDGPAVTDMQVMWAVNKLALGRGDSVSSADVAEELGVTPRNVGRKLRKLVDDGHLVGNVDEGYTLAPVTA